MKNYLIISLAIILLIACKNDKKTDPPIAPEMENKNTFIYVRLIKEIPNDTVINIYDYIQLFDSHGNFAEKTEIKLFTSTAYSGKKVKWRSAKNSVEKVKIKKIIKKSGEDILENGNISQDPDEVVRKINKNLKKDDEEHYSIDIEINNEKYTIDPKLRYHP